MISKRNRFFFTAILTLVTVTSLALINRYGLTNKQVLADPSGYSIAFNSTTNKIGTDSYSVGTFYDGEGEALTGLENTIEFEYVGFANPEDNWQTIEGGGYFTNIERISGITSFSLEKNSTNDAIGVYWSAARLFNDTRYAEFNAESSVSIYLDFGGYLPNYIKVVALGETPSSIKEGLISFSCADTYSLVVGGSYTLGSYPQTRVYDSTLISALNTAGGTLPTSADTQTWTSYKFYLLGSNATDFAWYQDVINGDDKYRGVYFTSYRTDLTDRFHYTGLNNQYNNAYYVNTTYWFKYEPIQWDILSVNETSGPLVISHKILDSREYYNNLDNRTIGGVTVYPCNYKESNIRSWINNNFYNQAFSSAERSLINTTIVDNSAATTGNSPNPYACENTNDKMFLLSSQDVTNSTYGFSTNATRFRQPTDYAKSIGIYASTMNGNSSWWLRSPDYSYYLGAHEVYRTGDIYYDLVCVSYYGVLPAFRIDL